MSFLSGLFGGSNPTLNSQLPKLGNIGDTATKTGQRDVGDASDFFHSILSGDATKVLAPQISGIKGQGQQKLQTLSQFGNRSGGTNASAQMTGDNTRASINDLIAKLTGSAATNLASLGTSQSGLGLDAYQQQLGASQLQMQNWQNSILGKGIGTAVGAAEAFGLGAAGGALPGGVGAAAGGQGALASFLG